MAALALAVVALALVIYLNLLPALFAGLLVHELVHLLAPRIFGSGYSERRKVLALILLLTVIVLVLGAAITSLVLFLRSDTGHLGALLEKMAEILDRLRDALPEAVRDSVPVDADALKDLIVGWLRDHAREVKSVSGEVGHGLAYALIGMVIGAMVSLRETLPDRLPGPLARALKQCAARLANAFRRVVFAQVRISLLNTGLTAFYLMVALRLFGVHLPLSKTMLVVTFVAGLMPVVGNLISNAIIVVISLSYSLHAAIASLGFLVMVHKLEYFMNARIVGSQIDAAAWELLLAMLVMEAAFGIVGVVAAPVFYAYIKAELRSRGWI